MNRSLLAVGFLALFAPASEAQKKSRCTPVPKEFAMPDTVYRDCDVQIKVEQVTSPRVEVAGRADGTTGCYGALFEVVVDTTGRIVESNAKLIRTNNQAFGAAVKRNLSEVRYKPAERDGKRVQQLTRYKATYTWVSNGNAPIAGGIPNC